MRLKRSTNEIQFESDASEYNMEEITSQPGEWVTVAARTTTGTAS